MATGTVEINEKTPDILKKIGDIFLARGLTRRVTIRGDTLQAVGEAGIGLFYLTKENNLLKVEAKNKEALQIIDNLIRVGLEELIEFEDVSSNLKEQICSVCETTLKYVGEKNLLDGFKVKIMTCPKCNRVEMYKV